jgi:hypothetical protein
MFFAKSLTSLFINSGGQTFANEEFQASIKNYVPEGHTFKAFPI